MTSPVSDLPRPVFTPRADGLIDSGAPALLPVMAPRLQADCDPTGGLDLALWGAGRLGRLRFTGWDGPYLYGPNRVTAASGGLYVAQSAPVALLRGVRFTGFDPARRCAWWDEVKPRAAVARAGARRRVCLGWGVVLIETRDDDLVVAVGLDDAEAQRGLSLGADQIIAEAAAYIARCDQLAGADPLMRSMGLQGIHAILSSIRADEHGRFAGLAAGQAYSAPARTYYRDGHWTLQGLLTLAPEAVRAQIEILAQGMQPDGEAPSGVILTGPAQSQAWEKVRQNHQIIKLEHLRPGDWWSDHFDSPLFFILTTADYVRATGDREPLIRHWPLITAIVRRYQGFDVHGTGLPVKPHNDRDWADNVYRGGYVAYDLGLWIGALDAIADLGRDHDPGLAHEAAAGAVKARANLDAALLQPSGWYGDYGRNGAFVEDHLTLDSLTLLRYDAVSPERAAVVLQAVQARLETRHNGDQPYGDWGVMCAYPPFKRRADTRAKTAFAYRYHNGSDWPYLDGIYAHELLRRGLPGWRYPLLAWWRQCLQEGWMGAVEYFAPPFGRGSLLQGWSGLPAAVAMHHKSVVLGADRSVIEGEGL